MDYNKKITTNYSTFQQFENQIFLNILEETAISGGNIKKRF